MNQEKYCYKNSLYTDSLLEAEVIDLFEKSNSIIINGFFSAAITNVFFDNPRLLKKLTWLTWGEDIYRFSNKDFDISLEDISLQKFISLIRITKANIQLSLQLNVLPLSYSVGELKRSFVIKDMANIIGIEKDFLIVKNIYRTNANYIYGFHPFFVDWQNLDEYFNSADERRKKSNYKSQTFNILVGNSGSITNQHVEAFELIQKFSTNRINVYCPLSYGNIDNIEKVINSGINNFGDIFIPMKEIMNTSKYMSFLTEIDVAIMNHSVQEGIGTIITLILLGAKIYMRTNISSYSFFTQRGIKMFDINEVNNTDSMNTFVYFDEEIRRSNREIVIREFSEFAWAKTWGNIFMQISDS